MELEIHREGTFSGIPKWRVYVDEFEEKSEVEKLQSFFAAQGFKMEPSNPNYEWRLGSELFEDYAHVRRLAALAQAQGKPTRVFSSLKNTHLENQPLFWVLLLIDPSHYALEPIVSPRGITTLVPLSFMARSSEAQAAINAGFFAITGRNRGMPIGVLQIGSSLIAKPYQGRTSLGWSDNNHAAFGEISWSGRVNLKEGWMAINALNQYVKGNTLVLYNPYYVMLTPALPGQLTEIVVENEKCVSVNSTGGTSVKPGQYVLAGYGTNAALLAEHVQPGDEVRIHNSFNDDDPQWGSMGHIIQAGPFLIRGGTIQIESEGFSASILNLRHPRSVIGLTEKGKWAFFVGDGRDGMHSAGFTLQEVADLLKRKNIAYALNLDGGGSSELMIGDKIFNSPSEKKERPISYGVGAKLRSASSRVSGIDPRR
jgi:hypothetical protein